MKYIVVTALCFLSFNLFDQKTCEYAANVKDSIGTYKSTKEYLISEKVFGGNSSVLGRHRYFGEITVKNDMSTAAREGARRERE